MAVVLLNSHATDLNGVAFARTHASFILQALQLRPGQQTALLALQPNDRTRKDVVDQCVQLVGDHDARFLALQAMLALAVVTGKYDARSRTFLATVADHFGITWRAIAAVELAVAIQLFDDAAAQQDQSTALLPSDSLPTDETLHPTDTDPEQPTRSVDQLLIERRKKKMRYRKAIKISGITLVGGMLFGLTGGLIAPALLSALAGVGVASAAGLAAAGTVTSGAVVGSLFGVAGAGFTVKKARKRISTNLEEFDFERPDDPRVVEARERKAERERKKLENLIAERMREEAAERAQLAIEDDPNKDHPLEPSEETSFDPEKELPRPSVCTDDEDYDDEKPKKQRRFGMRKKKREKLKVGANGLEAASHIPSLHVCICVPAWLTERSFGVALDQFEPALRQELPCSQHIALRWESRRLYAMGLAFAKFWASKATVTTVQQAYPYAVAAASTVAGAVAFAFAIPLTIMSCMDYIDNPWSILVSRSNGAGDELADVLVERSYGHRPVTLFGYSIGARVVFKCLESLASRGAHGIVDNVFLMGAAVTADPERWKKIRPVVAGRIVNAYGSYDWALAFFHRGCGHGVYVSGLRRVEVTGVENLNMAYLGVEGHRVLKDCVPRVMRAMGVGVGYIVMPPAKLRKKRDRSSKGSKKSAGSGNDMQGEEGSSPGSSDESLSDNAEEHGRRFDQKNRDTAWESNGSPLNEESGDRLEIDDDMTLPPSLDAETPNGELQASLELAGKDDDSKLSKKSKRKKPKSWLSWGSWSGYGSSSAGKSKSSSLLKANSGNEGIDANNPSVIPSDAEELDRTERLETYCDEEQCSREQSNGSRSQFDLEEIYGAGALDEIAVESDMQLGEDNEDNEPFDWEKQRRIWEEQERQMQERGFADSAIEIEMRNKMVLGVAVEVAGRRLSPFLEQDAEVPIAKKQDIFTNCMEDQRGMVVRIYEHERLATSVSLNMMKHNEQYPKLLGEMEIKLRNAAVKGKLRVAVNLWADEKGDVYASMEERLIDGSIGEKADIYVPRSDLCTMEERIRLEAAERKRLEAQLQKEMRKRASTEVPALPAPPGDDGLDKSFEAVAVDLRGEKSASYGMSETEEPMRRTQADDGPENELTGVHGKHD